MEGSVHARAEGKAEWKTLGKRLFEELTIYLRGLMTMQRLDSNWVYVVSLSSSTERGWGISWIDIVNNRLRYFHPVGKNGWPATPPNYIASPEIPDQETSPHFLYTLGAGFAPVREVRTGSIYPNGRVWCMLDTLFTSKTISAARDASKLREAKMGQV